MDKKPAKLEKATLISVDIHCIPLKQIPFQLLFSHAQKKFVNSRPF
jgi:hypothetical protein